jgi:outer membrane protein OmpA-like peptidoglycan-associated protein
VRPGPVAAPSVSLAREAPAPAERLSEVPRPEWLPPSDRPGDDPPPPAQALGPSTPLAQAGHSENGSAPTPAGPSPPVGETSAPAPGADPLLAVRLVAVTAPERPPAASTGASLAAAGASLPGATPSTPARRSDVDVLEEDLAHLGLRLRRLADGTLHVNLRRLVPFEFNSADVKPESRPFLDRLADVLRRLDGFVVQVVGHTDDSGPRDYNAQLSRRRAEAVTSYLRQQGVPGTRLRAEGRGASEPMTEVSDLEDAGPSDQRRIELFINRVPGTRA